MSMKKIFLFAMILGWFAHDGSATSLTGSLKNADGTGANGYLYLSLSQQAALAGTGGCGGPAEVVPTYQVKIQVINGALQGSPVVYGNDCMLAGTASNGSTYYNVIFKDNNGNTLFTDRWIITGSTIDIGTIISAVITGTTGTLGSVGVIVAQPIADQTVTQPSGTVTSVNFLTVTGKLIGPAGFMCDASSGECSVGGAMGFVNGLGTGPTSSSVIYVGNVGNFYNRVVGTPVSCNTVADGWMGVRNDTSPPEFVLCFSGAVYSLPLVLGQ